MSMYRGYNVHSYTPDVQTTVGEVNRIVASLGAGTGIDPERWRALFVEMRKTLGMGCPHVNAALSNMATHYDARLGGYRDPEIGPEVNITAVVHCLWGMCRGGDLEAFRETMAEVGSTCIQGHSHRLIWLLVSMHRSILSCTE